MPYKCEKLHIPRHLDRRVKLSLEDREDIRLLYETGLLSIRGLAVAWQVSKRLIQFTLFPERLEAAKRNRDWRRYYTRRQRAAAMRNHRRHKHQLYREGKL